MGLMKMHPGRDVQAHTVPIALLLRLVQLVNRWHIPADELLSEAGLSEKILEDPPERLPVATMCALLQRARVLTGEPGIGYYLGLQHRVSNYGYVGFAALSASTVREALELAVQFAPVFSTALAVTLHVEERTASLYVEEHADLEPARDIVLISMLLGLREVGSALTGRSLQGQFELAIPEPDYYPKFAALAPNWRFGQPINRMHFDAASLDLPIVTADRAACRQARRLCERALDELGFDAGLAHRVRRLLASDEGGFPSFAQVAAHIHLSPRTLKRRLAAQGLSFSALVDRERREKALDLLRSSRLSVEDVAERLDYTAASSFVRAFHRWTGQTPAAYRRAVWRGSTTDARG
jgi:AraC-like DNA-binding protein